MRQYLNKFNFKTNSVSHMLNSTVLLLKSAANEGLKGQQTRINQIYFCVFFLVMQFLLLLSLLLFLIKFRWGHVM